MPQRVIESLEELKDLTGQEVGVSDWFEVSQGRIDQFAAATLDHQWIHTDAERAQRESPFGATIAHGFLTLSLISHLVSQTVKLRGDFKMGINYGLNRVRFPSPVRSGARARARLKLDSIDDTNSEYVQIVWTITVEVEGAVKPSLVAEWLVRYYR
jgi:acyl dehydratase